MALTRTPSRVRALLAGTALAALAATGAVVLPHVAGATPGQQVTLTATYTSGTTQYTSNATLTVK